MDYIINRLTGLRLSDISHFGCVSDKNLRFTRAGEGLSFSEDVRQRCFCQPIPKRK